MGRCADAPVDPVSDHLMALDSAPETTDQHPALTIVETPAVASHRGETSRLPAFVLGTLVGAVAGALLGTLLSPHTRAYLVGLYQLASRRLSSAERDKLRFELLLQ